jgi:hypothetical protein
MCFTPLFCLSFLVANFMQRFTRIQIRKKANFTKKTDQSLKKTIFLQFFTFGLVEIEAVIAMQKLKTIHLHYRVRFVQLIIVNTLWPDETPRKISKHLNFLSTHSLVKLFVFFYI